MGTVELARARSQTHFSAWIRQHRDLLVLMALVVLEGLRTRRHRRVSSARR